MGSSTSRRPRRFARSHLALAAAFGQNAAMITITDISARVAGRLLLDTASVSLPSGTKAGLVGMARSLARELGSRGITTNVVAPGFIETDMTAVLPEEQQQAYREQIPLGRMGSTTEIADAVTWLASDNAGYVTGAVIPVDGGLGMGH